ncbi:DNA-directed RNA polymerase I complex large subunit Nuc1 [Schizosaccharomyces japonicus yFS275]|uniref:DNA-directed RNA polymerase subunit n=1 Tax=Schizosaccharomyces japonicus (strain yFS275 / FY16936) TaxID=402676 RepID=B6K3G0_SCHJY|nr:DNA-directed RNA polymerase I complex large subunit Nuc1 [Schizosaccharomyces japonicus yFS275]EEB08017.1 DNA-directed RNA polymerase I complex large subunit Nuc1 [Schizosaccharomyces japonicus yFS275]
MNIAQPVSSEIKSVKFGIFDVEDIEKISVKQIVNPVLLDNLNHPTSGGLYDLALGPYLKNTVCATCHMDERYCPGHFGHITLPVPAYHPLFFPQMYSLLRATCLYCHHFKLSKVTVHLFACRFKLLDHGLLIESQRVESITLGNSVSSKSSGGKDGEGSESEDSGIGNDDMAKDAAALMRLRDEFVDKCIADAKKIKLVRAFFHAINSRKQCDNCQSFSPTFRKEGFAKIFEVPLTGKNLQYMEQTGRIRSNVLRDSAKSSKDDEGFSEDSNSEGEGDDIDLMEEDPNPFDKKLKKRSTEAKYMTSTEVRNHLRRLFTKEGRVMSLLFAHKKGKPASADMFFLHNIAVPPTRFRPASKMGDEVHENIQNELLTKILQSSIRIADLSAATHATGDKEAMERGSRAFEQLVAAFVQLQHDVNSLIDSGRNPTVMAQGRVPPPGIKQILEKKEGLFRKHMMGKRVNYAARSVISPDPNIETNEIGVPPVFAVKLTFPEPVTPYNYNELRKAVINGPSKWPGATHIQNEDGTLVSLMPLTVEQRTALANQLMTPQSNIISSPYSYSRIVNTNKKVFRHVRNGDMLILNRQPTLHKPSMMCHKARILPGEKTIRMHYANCNSYNADFDGDEMNMHFPQSMNARAEAQFIANTDSQYLVPTSGDPIRGLIQDHVVMGVWLTNKDSFFTRDEYQQLLFQALKPDESGMYGRIKTVPPALIRPKPMYTGKQIITTILLNLKPADRPGLNLKSKAKVASKYWSPTSEEGAVLFDDGVLIHGILDKSSFGASTFGMVHSIHELYGADIAGRLLSVLSRLFTAFAQMRGFTCRMDDLRLDERGDAWRRELLENGKDFGLLAHCDYVQLPIDTSRDLLNANLEEVIRDDEKLQGLDAAMKGKMNGLTSSIINKCIPEGLLTKFPKNHMQAMTVSGAKGSNVNVSQISCLLGQQELEGRRVPLMVSGKSLPSFLPFDTSAKAGGFIASRFLTGMCPQEYYFHCMAGREGLIDTAVKTSRSGYLQRCLMKHLEGLSVQYDHTVRDADGSVVQFRYGEDALDVTKQKHLYQFEFSARNYKSLIQKYKVKSVLSAVDSDTASSYAKKALKKPHKYDPVLDKYPPSRYLGSVSEKFQKAVDEYTKKNPDNLIASKKESKQDGTLLNESKFKALMQLRYQQSLVEPGEGVGVMASQSVGEPSTQMTLNTFHFAGFGAKNVTLGIPRLREIIMTASASIKTPTMTLRLNEGVSEERSKQFCKEVSKLVLAEVVKQVVVTERISGQGSDTQSKSYSIKLELYPKSEYEEEYGVTQEEIEASFTTSFLKVLGRIIKADIAKTKQRKSNDSVPKIGEALAPLESFGEANADAAEQEAMEDDDNDATNARMTTRSKQHASYDGPDDDDRLAMQAERAAAKDGDDMEEDDGYNSDESVSEYMARKKGKNSVSLKEKKKLRLTNAREILNNCRRIDFDDKSGEWALVELEFPITTEKLLMVSLVEQACHKSVVHEIPGISRCYPKPPDSAMDKIPMVITEGVNLRAVWEFYEEIHMNDLYTNDIAAVLRIYGVEAARNAIVREISSVFGVYGIDVDHRHLSLIADYMTFEGGYKAFNRMGIEYSTSPFAKMSFETTCHFLTDAALSGSKDEVMNPSARLVVGRVGNFGTGSFDLLTPVVAEN